MSVGCSKCRHTGIVVVRDGLYAMTEIVCLRHALVTAVRADATNGLYNLCWIACGNCAGEGRLPSGIRCPHCAATFAKMVAEAANNPLYTGRKAG